MQDSSTGASMLTAGGSVRIGNVFHQTAVGTDRNVMVYTVTRNGLVFDSDLSPASRSEPRPVHYLWLVFSGTVSIDGRTSEGPTAWVMPESAFIGARGLRSHRLISSGASFHAMELHVRDDAILESCVAPEPIHLSELTWRRALELSQALLQPAHDSSPPLSVRPLLESLCLDGQLDPTHLTAIDRRPSTVQATFWKQASLAYRNEGPRSRIKLLSLLTARGLGQRTVERAIAALFSDYLLPRDSWQDMIGYMRLSLASLLLSSPEFDVATIARTVGFSHANALTNAYRRAGLPSPREIRAAHELRARGSNAG